jgi:hypothetical protein
MTGQRMSRARAAENSNNRLTPINQDEKYWLVEKLSEEVVEDLARIFFIVFH